MSLLCTPSGGLGLKNKKDRKIEDRKIEDRKIEFPTLGISKLNSEKSVSSVARAAHALQSFHLIKNLNLKNKFFLSKICTCLKRIIAKKIEKNVEFFFKCSKWKTLFFIWSRKNKLFFSSVFLSKKIFHLGTCSKNLVGVPILGNSQHFLRPCT